MEFVKKVTLASDSSTILLNNIPQDAEDLVLILSARTSRNDTNDYTQITLNGSVTYESQRIFWGNGTFVYNVTDNSAVQTTSTTGISNGFNNSELYFADYRSLNKKVVNMQTAYLGGTTSTSGSSIVAALFNLTTAITSITLTPRFGSVFIAGSSASLYKIVAGSNGTTTVS